MFGRAKRSLRRRKLRPVVAILPLVLKSRYGASDFYTTGQVRRTVEVMKLRGELIPYTFAVGCTRDDFAAAPEVGTNSYAKLRQELVELFEIENPNFTTKALTSTRLSGVRNPTNDEVSLYGPYGPGVGIGPAPHLGNTATEAE